MKWSDNYCYTHSRPFEVLYYPSGAVGYGCPECQANVRVTASDRAECEEQPYFDRTGTLRSKCDDCPYNPINGGKCE